MRGLLRLHADAFARGPLAMLFALGTVALIVFSPNGLDPRDLPRMLPIGSFSRLATLIVAGALMRFSTQRMMFPPGATYVRASAIPRWTQKTVIALFVAAAQLPIPIALSAGGAAHDALAVLVCLATLAIAVRVWEAALALAFATLSLPLLGAVLFLLALDRAYREAPMRGRSVRSIRLPLQPSLQIALAYLRSLSSGKVVLASLPPLLGLLLVRGGDDPAARARSLAPAVAALSACSLVFPIGSMLRILRPLVRKARAPLLIATAIVATPSVAFAAGTRALAHDHGLFGALGLIALLVVVEGHLAARRRDVTMTWMLVALPLTIVCTLRSTAIALVGLLSLLLPPSEVRRAHDR